MTIKNRKTLWHSTCLILMISLLFTLSSTNIHAQELNEENVTTQIMDLIPGKILVMPDVRETYAIDPSPLLSSDVWIKLCQLVMNANLKNKPRTGSIAHYWGAQCYIKGIVVDKSEFDGIIFLKEAAMENSEGASMQLAEFYKKGIHVSKNIEKAMAYTLLARKISEYRSVVHRCLFDKTVVLSLSEKQSCLARIDSLEKEREQLKTKL